METRSLVICGIAGIVLAGATILANTNSPGTVMSTPPIYVPNLSLTNQPLPASVLAWNHTTQSADVADGQTQVRFVFYVTNVTAGNVVIRDIHACGCITVQSPPRPWTLAPGTNGQIHLTLDVQGKAGVFYKSVYILTDQGDQTLKLHINMLPSAVPVLTDAERARDLAAAKIDRQAVFRGNCAKCHLKSVAGKYGQPLYQSVCAICHDVAKRSPLVPDLHALKTPTNDEFWRTWIISGKPGSVMPAFAHAQGGPLSDTQIASLASYLNYTIPSHVPPAPPTNTPAK